MNGYQNSQMDALVTHRRLNRPPLRYNGRLVAKIDRVFSHGQSIMIEIWSRNRGGFVLVHSVHNTRGLQTDAHVLSSMTACMAQLEKFCVRMKSAESVEKTVTSFLSDFRFRQQFEILVGEFLCRLTEDERTRYGEAL